MVKLEIMGRFLRQRRTKGNSELRQTLPCDLKITNYSRSSFGVMTRNEKAFSSIRPDRGINIGGGVGDVVRKKIVCKKKIAEVSKSKKQNIARVKRVFASELKSRATGAELKFKELLDSNNIAYVFQYPIQCGKSFFIVDFYLPEYQCVVEVDGGYHLTPAQEKKDVSRTLKLVKKKMVRSVVRFLNEEVDDTDRVLKKLALAVCPFAKALVTTGAKSA